MQPMIYTGDITSVFNQYWWILILIVVVTIVFYILLTKPKTKKILVQPIEEDMMNEFIQCYGGIDNILNAELDGKRLKIKISDIDQVNIEKFKQMGATGIFITGQTIKMVLPYDMNKMVYKINESKMEENDD